MKSILAIGTRGRIGQLLALFKWDDAIVLRKRQLDALMLTFSPQVTGFEDGLMTCSQCSAQWRSDGTAVANGHLDWCAAARIQEFIQIKSFAQPKAELEAKQGKVGE